MASRSATARRQPLFLHAAPGWAAMGTAFAPHGTLQEAVNAYRVTARASPRGTVPARPPC